MKHVSKMVWGVQALLCPRRSHAASSDPSLFADALKFVCAMGTGSVPDLALSQQKLCSSHANTNTPCIENVRQSHHNTENCGPQKSWAEEPPRNTNSHRFFSDRSGPSARSSPPPKKNKKKKTPVTPGRFKACCSWTSYSRTSKTLSEASTPVPRGSQAFWLAAPRCRGSTGGDVMV